MSEQRIILVVEDEEDMRKVVAEELEGLGHKVYQTGDGLEGLRIAEDVRPDLVISDVVMPKSDGNQLLKNLRETDFGKDIPFIVVTARRGMRDYFEVIKVAAFFEKPFKLKELCEKVEEVLAEKKSGSQKGEHAAKKRSDGKKRSDISVQEEALLKDSIYDVDIKAQKAPILSEEKKTQRSMGRQITHTSIS